MTSSWLEVLAVNTGNIIHCREKRQEKVKIPTADDEADKYFYEKQSTIMQSESTFTLIFGDFEAILGIVKMMSIPSEVLLP